MLKRNHAAAVVVIAAVALFGAACSSDDSSESGSGDSTTTTMMEETTTTADPGASTSDKDIVDTAAGAGDFTTLVAAVEAAGLVETLKGDGPFTVFAPTDAAFAALPEGTVDTLLADPQGQLTEILTYHVVPGKVLAADVAGMDGQDVTTVNGATFKVGVSSDGKVTLTDGAGNTVGVVTTDIVTSNGVIHVIDAVLMPPS